MRSLPTASLSLRDLEYAVAVGRERNFSRAAEACGVSQAALSEQVRKLERLLGFALFERTTRRVEPTARGAAVLREAEAVLAATRRLLDEARRHAEPLTGELRIGAIATLGPYYLPALIARCRDAFPRLALRLREGTTDDLLAQLRRGELDAALVALPVPGDDLRADPLFFEPFRLASPADHPLAAGPPASLAELRAAPLLLMEEGHCLRDQTLALCEGARAPGASRHATSLEMLRQMIAAGEGVSVVPALAARGPVALDGIIAYRALGDPPAGRTIALVRRATETRAGDLAAIGAALRSALPAEVAPV